MKKLMMMFVALLMGMATQAASCSWSMTGITAPDGGNPQTGWIAYIMDASTYEAFNALAGNKKASFASENKSFETRVVNARGYKVNYTADGYQPLDEINTYLVLFNNADASSATHYAVTGIESNTIGEGGANVTISFGKFAEATSGWQAVPEPTTGLLLLLGVAGLALRRKQA